MRYFAKCVFATVFTGVFCLHVVFGIFAFFDIYMGLTDSSIPMPEALRFYGNWRRVGEYTLWTIFGSLLLGVYLAVVTARRN